jgi:hypothetical protein
MLLPPEADRDRHHRVYSNPQRGVPRRWPRGAGTDWLHLSTVAKAPWPACSFAWQGIEILFGTFARGDVGDRPHHVGCCGGIPTRHSHDRCNTMSYFEPHLDFVRLTAAMRYRERNSCTVATARLRSTAAAESPTSRNKKIRDKDKSAYG